LMVLMQNDVFQLRCEYAELRGLIHDHLVGTSDRASRAINVDDDGSSSSGDSGSQAMRGVEASERLPLSQHDEAALPLTLVFGSHCCAESWWPELSRTLHKVQELLRSFVAVNNLRPGFRLGMLNHSRTHTCSRRYCVRSNLG